MSRRYPSRHNSNSTQCQPVYGKRDFSGCSGEGEKVEKTLYKFTEEKGVKIIYFFIFPISRHPT